MTVSPAAGTPARILVQVDGAALARWVLWLIEALEHRPGTQVYLRITERGGHDRSSALRTLLSLGTHAAEADRTCGADRDRSRCTRRAARQPAGFKPDVVIDLTDGDSRSAQSQTSRLRPLYDGNPGETALASALFFRGTPQITIERVCPATTPVGHHLRHGLARGSRRRRRRHRSGRLARRSPLLLKALSRGHHGFRRCEARAWLRRPIGNRDILSIRPRMSPALPPAPPTGFAATDRTGASAGVSSSPARCLDAPRPLGNGLECASPIRSTIFTPIRFR